MTDFENGFRAFVLYWWVRDFYQKIFLVFYWRIVLYYSWSKVNANLVLTNNMGFTTMEKLSHKCIGKEYLICIIKGWCKDNFAGYAG